MIRVMLVDDEILVRVGLKAIINWEKYGYTIVCEAGGVKEALEKMEEYRPQILFTDLCMDGMDGFELIKECVQRYPGTQIVVLSSYNDFENVRYAMKLGAKDYIFKLTVGAEELLKVLGELQVKNEDTVLDEKVIRKNLSAIKSNLITAGIQRNYSSREAYAEEFSSYGFAVDIRKTYQVLYISTDNYRINQRQREEQRNLQMLKYSMENIIQEVMSQQFCAETFDYEGGDVLVLIQNKQRNEDIQGAFEKVLGYMKQYLNLSVSAAISDMGIGPEELPELVCQGQNLLEQRFFGQPGSLLLAQSAGVDKRLFLPDCRGFLDELAVHNSAGAKDFLNTYFKVLFTWKGIPLETIRMDILELYGMVVRHAKENKIQWEEINQSLGLVIYDVILYDDYLETIREKFSVFVEEYMGLLEGSAARERPEIRKVKNYIREHLKEELSVEDMADMVSMSKSYFSHLFKRETGKSFVDYLNQARLEQAQKLLLGTSMRISEIAELCGYQNMNYFGILFKRVTGRSPGEFRSAAGDPVRKAQSEERKA